MKVEPYLGELPSIAKCINRHTLLNTQLTPNKHACYWQAPLTGDFDGLAQKVADRDELTKIPFFTTAHQLVAFFSSYTLNPAEQLAVDTMVADMYWAEMLVKMGKGESIQLRVLNYADYMSGPARPIFHYDGCHERILRPYSYPTTQFWEHLPPADVFDMEKYLQVESARIAAIPNYDVNKEEYRYWEGININMTHSLNSYINHKAQEPVHFFPAGTYIRFNQRFLHRTPPQSGGDFKCRFLLVVNC